MATHKLDSKKFYSTEHGHNIVDLKFLKRSLSNNGCERFIYFAGDSSLDNKLWIKEYNKCVKYAPMLSPPSAKEDICFWLNKFLLENKSDLTAINTAVEASTLHQRRKKLLKQDEFIQQNIKPNDILIVSVGGNDLAKQSTVKTKYHMAKLLLSSNIEESDSFKFLVKLFKDQVQDYINDLTKLHTPKYIIVCSVYFPALHGSGWADGMLSLMDYKKNYKKIHKIIRHIYEAATKKIEILFSTVIPIPLFDILDFKESSDYVDRVEPSSKGGRKIAEKFVEKILPLSQ